MKHFLLTLLLATLCATGHGQTIKSLGYNTSGQVVYAGTNPLTFTNDLRFGVGGMNIQADGTLFFFDQDGTKDFFVFDNGAGGADEARARTNLGLGATWLTNTNVTNFRTAIGLGATNDVVFESLNANEVIAPLIQSVVGTNSFALEPTGIVFGGVAAGNTRTNLGLGATNNVTFKRLIAGATNGPANAFGDIVSQNGSGDEFHISSSGFTYYSGTNAQASLDIEGRVFSGGIFAFEQGINSSGNIIISNQSATNNGLLFIYRTNNEPFLGLANFIASNNTTISNETLFRVGVAEATNKAAQFGFRSTNTNGEGVAVFSTFGYNALMMIGPSVRSATNTNGIEADIYSISPTNKVATLIDTNTGATLMHRPVGFNTNASAPANTTNVAGWIQIYVGTNNVRVPYYQ
jgi:hypothetical protein